MTAQLAVSVGQIQGELSIGCRQAILTVLLMCRILVHVSRVDSIIAYSIPHKTTGTLPNHDNLLITYTGPLMQERWLSFVDETLNNNFPCDSGIHASGISQNCGCSCLSSCCSCTRLKSLRLSCCLCRDQAIHVPFEWTFCS